MFLEVQVYDSSHPIIVNLNYVVQIEPASYGSNLWLKEQSDGLCMIRTSNKYNELAHCLNAR